MLPHKLLTMLLLALCLLQGRMLFDQYSHPVEVTTQSLDETNASHQTVATSVNQPPVLEALSAFKQIKERTLFSKNRQLPKEKPPAKKPLKPARPAPNPGFELVGVYLSTQEKIALIKTRNKNKAELVHLDETYEKWTLYDLTAHEAKLESQGQQLTITMMKENKQGGQVGIPVMDLPTH